MAKSEATQPPCIRRFKAICLFNSFSEFIRLYPKTWQKGCRFSKNMFLLGNQYVVLFFQKRNSEKNISIRSVENYMIFERMPTICAGEGLLSDVKRS